MGIRFFCPNRHRLNVKSEFAGKVGFCPICNVRMLIPRESTRESGEHYHPGSILAQAFPETDAELKERENDDIPKESYISLDEDKGLDDVEHPDEKVTKPIINAVTELPGEIIRQVADSSSDAARSRVPYNSDTHSSNNDTTYWYV